MGNFLKNLITNAANSVNESIKKRVEDGTFNRMAADFGNDVNSLAAGMANLVGMAEQAFDKLKEKAADKASQNRETEEHYEAYEPREADAPQEPQAACVESETYQQPQPAYEPQGGYTPSEPFEHDEELEPDPDYVPGVLPLDEVISTIAKEYQLDDYDIELYNMARMSMIAGLFFANCDGNYTKRERDCIEAFEDMLHDYIDGSDGDARNYIFDNLERPYTIGEVIGLTHRLVDSMKYDDDKRQAKESVDYIISHVVEADVREDNRTEAYYAQWRREFGL